MLKHLHWLLIPLIILSLSACAKAEPEECEVCEECDICEECPQNPFPDGLVLPQIFVQGRLYWSDAELANLKTNVTDPITAYFESEDHLVVSISVTSEDLPGPINTILVEVIVSNLDGDNSPISMGLLIEKEGGSFPLWEPESMGP
jgi:hypothetical protein